MNNCKINSRGIDRVLGMAKRLGWNEEQIKNYCINKGYDYESIVNQKIKQDIIGVTEKVAPVIPVVEQISKLDGYINSSTDTTNSIISYYSDFSEEFGVMKKDFEREVLTCTFINFNSDVIFKNPNQIISGKGTLLNNELRKLKIGYINSLLDIVKNGDNIDFLRIQDSDPNDIKYKKFYAAINYSWNKLQDLKQNDNYKNAINLYVKCKFFDKLIEDIPFVEINNQYRNIFDNNHYNFVQGKVKHFTGVSTDETASAIDQMSNLSKTILNFIPECRRTADGKLYPINGKTVTYDSFLSITSAFKKWVYSIIEDVNSKDKLRLEVINEWRKGINADFKSLFEKWVSKHSPSSFEKNKINTIAYILFGKYDNGSFITPEELRYDLASLLINTATSSYLEYEVNRDDNGIVNGITPTTLTERKYLSIKKSTESNLIASAYNNLINGIEIEIPKTGVEALKILENLLYAQLPDFEEFKRNSEIINGKSINSGELLIGVVDLLKTMSEYKKSETVSDFIRHWEEELKNTKNKYYSTILNYIKAISLSKKTNYKSVILNSEGNYLPLRQLPSLAYAKNEVFFDMIMEGLDKESHNTVIKNIANVLPPITRSSTIDGDSYKSFRQLEASDMITEAIMSDFLYNLYNPITTESGDSKHVIYLQPNCFADKSTNNDPGFDLSKTWMFEDKNGDPQKVNLLKLFIDIVESNDTLSKEKLKEYWRVSWFNELKRVYDNITDDYKKIFGLDKNIQNKEAVKYFEEFINKYGESSFVDLATKAGVDIVNNVHYVKGIVNGGPKYIFNPIIKALISITNNEEKFNKYYNDRLNKFLSKINSIDTNKANITQNSISSISEAYFLAHNLLAEPYNRIMFGNYYGHDIKVEVKLNEDGTVINTDELIDSAWKSQTKRLAIVGATYHRYSSGKEMGVSDSINIAVIKDEKSYVVNTNGEIDEIDAKDGSGDVSPLFSRQANISLGSAKAKKNKKTIWHFYDHKYNTAGMLKWAEYEITNERMRDSWGSPTKEVVKFKKMHSITFSIEQKKALADFIDGEFSLGIASLYNKMKKVVYRDYNSGEFKTIKNISFQYNSESNNLIAYSNVNTEGFEINNIYDIFQFLGGAWNYEWNSISEKYIGSEYNLDVLNEIVCKMGLKNNFIAYAVNKSGMKTGIKNINETSVLTNKDDLKYFTEKVKYGGLQMDADHTLEESESTEPSQMIGHVGQDGTSHEKIADLYSLLSNEIGVELSDYLDALNSENKKEKLTKLIGKSIVSSFERGDKDVISLANAFVSKATKDGNYDIPFNSSSINSLFTSTLFSDMSKKTSKRKYTGVGAVLNPSYNSKMYYEVGGKKIKFEELTDIIRADIKNRGLSMSIDEYMNSIMINGELNPFMTKPVFVSNNGIISEINPIEIGGEYIVTYKSLIDDSIEKIEKIKINDIHDLLKWRHSYSIGNYQKIEITVNSLAPRNLRGIDATYDIQIENRIYKISQIENPYNLALLHLNNKINLNDYLTNEFKELNPIMFKLIEDAKIISESYNQIYIRNLQKEFFNNLTVGDDFFGYTVTNINVRPTEIMIGRLYAKELGLLPGDNISDIDKDFFKRRMFDYYSIDQNPDKGYYDAILFDGSGEKLYIKISNTLNSKGFVENDDFVVRDNIVYNNSKQICSSHGKKFVKYIDSENNIHNYCIVDNVDRINELLKNHYTYVYKNLLESNLSIFGYNNEFGLDIKEYLSQAVINEKSKLNKHIIAVANNKYFAFRKSLNFVGTRIPCQSMQSFTPMRVVAFTDSEDNEIYIPTHEQWIEGSDYDIDKQYIIGYELLKNGKLITNFKEDSTPYIKEVAIKNKIIETILSVISDHKNLVNLTATVSMDNLKALKKRASSNDVPGDSANPASIFEMIVENASGKDTIGVTAVAGKAFSAICYYYNGLVKQVKGHIELSQYESAYALLRTIPLIPNLDWSWVIKIANTLDVNSDIYIELMKRREYSLNNDDAYLLIGEFLNASADNAKELILKKIKANGAWADIYIAGLIAGYSLDEIYNIMSESGAEKFIQYKSGSILDNLDLSSDFKKSDRAVLNDLGASEDFIMLYRLSLRLQLIGKLAGINQGFKTSKYDIAQSISSIERSYEKIFNWGKRKDDKIEFNLFKFFSDDEYRNSILNMDDSSLSPLKIIYNHPLFRTQWLSYLTTIEISNSLSRKNALDYIIGTTPYINKKNYNKEIYELDKRINVEWLKSIGFKFKLNPNRKKNNLNEDDIQELDKHNINRFISTMEFYVIPELKRIYPENYFIKNLTLGIRNIPDSKIGEKTVYYKVPLNMSDIDNDTATAEEYGKMFRGFNSLSNIMFDEINSIHNLLYVYEILVNKTFSQSSMNRFFSESFINDPNQFIESHARFLDYNISDNVVVDNFGTGPSIYKDYLIPSGKYYNIDKPSISELTKLPGFVLSNPNIIIYNDNNYLEVLNSNDIVGEEAEFVHNIGKAFVYKGRIFINSDKSDRGDLRHELSHIVIGMLKAQNKNAGIILEDFYNKNKEKFSRIEIELKNHPVYKNLKSSDLIEEAIAHYVASHENNFKEFVYSVSETTNLNDLEMYITDVVTDDTIRKVHDIQTVEIYRDGLLKQGFVDENCI